MSKLVHLKRWKFICRGKILLKVTGSVIREVVNVVASLSDEEAKPKPSLPKACRRTMPFASQENTQSCDYL